MLCRSFLWESGIYHPLGILPLLHPQLHSRTPWVNALAVLVTLGRHKDHDRHLVRTLSLRTRVLLVSDPAVPVTLVIGMPRLLIKTRVVLFRLQPWVSALAVQATMGRHR